MTWTKPSVTRSETASTPYKVDQSAPNLNRYSATRRVARAIFMGTAPTHQQQNTGLDDKQINLGVVQPGERPAIFGDALRRLTNQAKFMHSDLGRYWYSMAASLNGAARGDLSSEKVYVKLARMTCDQPGGRVAVSEVKGFISFAGKSGVRGRVVSREGNLVTQALLAGIVGGFGRGFSANANSTFSATRTNPDGSRSKLSAGDIVGGGFGQGAADAADTVSKYLIERAEQYQPVVEMPTGIDVEIVFLDGVYVRNSR